ncbi:transmembrane protein 179B-like isoform X2 [Acanthaster planci]|uniref:Transmembrane protein 179B-like isoform X2 n=1 Tax=Acanthaster planci TaxID=133434 RepID=A0A8B7YVF1_ACAPL|nr:transmembrane protein 179B-like isoform X2 [Acanthaster planci]
MAVEGCLMITETILYLAAFFSGLITAITVGISRVTFSGDCVLFAEVTWCNATAFSFTQLGNNGVCGFSIGLDVIVAFYALTVCCYHVAVFFKWTKERRWVMLPGIIINACWLLLLFIDSCILSVGFKRFCTSITEGQSIGSKITQCSADLSSLNWNLPKCSGEKSDHPSYSAGNFYGFLTTAQSASWFSVLFWALLLAARAARRCTSKEEIGSTEERKPMLS